MSLILFCFVVGDVCLTYEFPLQVVNVTLVVQQVVLLVVAFNLDAPQSLTCQVLRVVNIDEIIIVVFVGLLLHHIHQLTFVKIFEVNLVRVQLFSSALCLTFFVYKRGITICLRSGLVVEVLKHQVHVVFLH